MVLALRRAVASAAALWALMVLPVSAAPLAQWQTREATFAAGTQGAWESVSRRSDGREYLASGQPAPILSVRVEGTLHAPTTCAWDATARTLYLGYGAAGVTALYLFLIFLGGFILDWVSIVLVTAPIFEPLLNKFGVDKLWVGVMAIIVIQTSYLTPPMAPSIFYLRGIAPPEGKSRDIYLGSIPWIGLQLILVALIIAFPGIVDGFITEEVLLDDAAVSQQLDALPMPGLEPPALDLDRSPSPAPAPAGD